MGQLENIVQHAHFRNVAMLDASKRVDLKGNTKERIIESAKQLFADQGYQKTTIMDISKRAGLSDAALYEYFRGKEDLLIAIPDLWIRELLEDLDEQLFGIKGAVNKLRKFLWWYFRRVENSPLDAKIVYLHLKTNSNFLANEVYSNVKLFYSKVIDIFEEGRASGEFKADLLPNLARDVFVGTTDHLVTRWLLNDRAYPLFDNLEEIFNMMMDGFRCHPSPSLASADEVGGLASESNVRGML